MDDYFFDTENIRSEDHVFVLIIYDIIDNKKRIKLAKTLQGYGFRVQKSAFEAVISKKTFEKLKRELSAFASEIDSIKIYKIMGKGQVYSYGRKEDAAQEDIIVI